MFKILIAKEVYTSSGKMYYKTLFLFLIVTVLLIEEVSCKFLVILWHGYIFKVKWELIWLESEIFYCLYSHYLKKIKDSFYSYVY